MNLVQMNTSLNEAHIIQQLQKAFPMQIGDDAAVFPFFEDKSYLITKDLLIQDVHFRTHYQSPRSLAYKALQVNLSDIAAMGGVPKYILLGLSIPENMEVYLRDFLSSFIEVCQTAEVQLIGGDTTKSSDKFFISLTVIGITCTSDIKYRNTAKSGDIIAVAGKLGYAHLGFQMLETEKPGYENFKAAFLQPNAKLEEGKWFSQQNSITAMMDISDGLYIDLQRLAKSSHLGAEIELTHLPIEHEFRKACSLLSLNPHEVQLSGGEDYGLLVTIHSQSAAGIFKNFQTHFGYPLKMIGQMKEGKTLEIKEQGINKELHLQLFSHFNELKL